MPTGRREVLAMTEIDWGEVICYMDGFAYGIAPNGDTICLGTTTITKAMLASPTKGSTNQTINDIINLEIELRGEHGYGNKQKDERASSFRSRLVRNFEHRASATKRLTPSKRTALHQTK